MSLYDDLTGFRQQFEGLSKALSVLRGTVGDLERELTNTIDPSHRLILSRRLEDARREVVRLDDERNLVQAKIAELGETLQLAPRLQQVPLQHWDILWDLKRVSAFPEVHSFILLPPMVEENLDQLRQGYLACGYHTCALQMTLALKKRGWRAMLNLLYGPHPQPSNAPPLPLPTPCYMPSICTIGINVHELSSDSSSAELITDRDMLDAIARDRIYSAIHTINYADGGMFAMGQELRLCQGRVLAFDESWVARSPFIVIGRVTYQPQTPVGTVRSLLGKTIDAILRRIESA